MKTNGTAVQLSTQSLAEYTFNDMMSMGDVYYQSGLFKDIRSAAQAIVKIMKGRELGIPPASAMEIINVIEGKTALSGVAIAGIIKSSRKYRYDIVETMTRGATVEYFERVDGAWKSLGRTSFAEEDARRAGLAGKKNWREYPQNMMLWRALSNGGRMFCPDILAGVYTPEELGAGVDEDGSIAAEVQPIPPSEESDEQETPRSEGGPVTRVSSIQGHVWPRKPIVVPAASVKPEMTPQSQSEEPNDQEPRPEWLRAAAQDIREYLTQSELMELRTMWRDLQYQREEIVERIRSLAARYRVQLDLPEAE